MMVLNQHILNQQNHSQIIFHNISKEIMLCEIKPFMLNHPATSYKLGNSNIKLISGCGIYILFNNEYYGYIKDKIIDITPKSIVKNGKEYSIITITGKNKYIIIYTAEDIIFCGQYLDYEQLDDCLNIYTHQPNVFNLGQLIKLKFDDNMIETKQVVDCGKEYKMVNEEFNVIYFIEAIKCGRTKYAHNKLSYELKSGIDENTLRDYFGLFDNYLYIAERDMFVTTNQNKIVGIYHIGTKSGMIDDIC